MPPPVLHTCAPLQRLSPVAPSWACVSASATARRYLLWFDWFNIALTTLLFACLAVCFYHHHLYVTDREEYAMLHNQCLRWALPFGYFPILLTSLVLWGFNRHSAAPWVMLCVGWFTLTVFCARIIRKLGDDVR